MKKCVERDSIQPRTRQEKQSLIENRLKVLSQNLKLAILKTKKKQEMHGSTAERFVHVNTRTLTRFMSNLICIIFKRTYIDQDNFYSFHNLSSYCCSVFYVLLNYEMGKAL